MNIKKQFFVSFFIASQVLGFSLDNLWLRLKSTNEKMIYPPMVKKSDFIKLVEDFIYYQLNELYAASWNGHKLKYLYSLDQTYFESFAQVLRPAQNSELAFWGDLHGSVHSFTNTLLDLKDKGYINDNLKIIKENFYMIFLGDYVDRGLYGIEIVYLILSLKLKNPKHVFLIRGNHEDLAMNRKYGFAYELNQRFNMQETEMQPFYYLYNLLPAVLYLNTFSNDTTNFYIQCCHGGIELGFNPQDLLKSKKEYQAIRTLYRASQAQKIGLVLSENQVKQHKIKNFDCDSPFDLGFLWSDFEPDDENLILGFERSSKYGKSLTEKVLQMQSSQTDYIVAVFRAHQHYGSMLEKLIKHRGLVPLWNGLVMTFLSTHIEGFMFDSYGILKLNNSYNWNLNHIVL